MTTKVFNGTNVFLSRNLVQPELFDTVHDALKFNGANIFLCSDASRNAPNEFHVISYPEHEKFKDLQSKGCNLVGPRCVLSCAKEHRLLPSKQFTCCLAMDGVNILASGFEKNETADIAKMVTAMGGVMHTKPSSDVSFVIVKNVLAQKYKWALNNLRKPIVTKSWLVQCWKEHRVVPQESYRVPPFSGLRICVTGIRTEERGEMEKLVTQNGGNYSADLNKICTHLVCEAAKGDKYKVAKAWGIHTISKKWFHQSLARRACLSEELYPVPESSAASLSTLKTAEHHSQGKETKNSQYVPSSLATAPDSEVKVSARTTESDRENHLTSIYYTFDEAKKGNDSLADQQNIHPAFDKCVADDTQSDDDDGLYLCQCRIMLMGFATSELRKVVDMVRQGGGSRYMTFNEKMTHIVVGNPSESELKEIRRVAANGIIYVVTPAWLEDCIRQKDEVPVLQRHIAYDILLPKDPIFVNKPTTMTMTGIAQGNSSAPQPVADNNIREILNPQSEGLLDVKEKAAKAQSGVSNEMKINNSSSVFKGKLFRFSSTFPKEQKPEIVQWVNQGGGEMVDADQTEKNVHFTVERHGVTPSQTGSTYVSSHWIRSCLEDGLLLDVGSHIIYSPLPCQIPLPGSEGCRLCVSQYNLKERQLLRNLCYILGVKFIEKLTKKVTHLLCKVSFGDKYNAARKWGIQIVTDEWIYECIQKNKIVDLKLYFPKEPEDLEARLSALSQDSVQTVKMTSIDDTLQFSSKSNDTRNRSTVGSVKCAARDEAEYPSNRNKKAKLLGNEIVKHPLPCDPIENTSLNEKSIENNVSENTTADADVPDVASAIEDLLEETSKLPLITSQFVSSNSTMLGQRYADPLCDPRPSNRWTNRVDKVEEKPSSSAGSAKECYDTFSDTQTSSQVVSYEEDLSGRQMIIEKARTRSSMP